MLPGGHFEKAKGSPKDNIDYCSKVCVFVLLTLLFSNPFQEEGRVGGPYRGGVEPRAGGSQGIRADLLALRDAVKGGKRDREIYDDDQLAPTAIRHGRGLEKLVSSYSTAKPRDDINVILLYGAAGTGKSHYARELAGPEPYYFDGNGNGFWLNYKGESDCILDDFGGHVLRPLDFQRLCDKYPYTLNLKGSQVACAITSVFLCSNFTPWDWWNEKTKYDRNAIDRRIHEVYYFTRHRHALHFVTIDPLNKDDWAVNKFMHYLMLEKTPVMMKIAERDNQLGYSAVLDF